MTADILLVDRCVDGHEDASRELFRLHHKRVHATLYRVLGQCSEMDDLIQESFIQVFRSLPNYRAESRLATWIDRITVRVAYRYINKSKKLPIPTENLDQEELQRSTPSAQVSARVGVRHLYAALNKLPAAARVAFALHEIDGRSVVEVAEIVGSSVSATKLRIWRARRALFKFARLDPVLAEMLTREHTDEPQEGVRHETR